MGGSPSTREAVSESSGRTGGYRQGTNMSKWASSISWQYWLAVLINQSYEAGRVVNPVPTREV